MTDQQLLKYWAQLLEDAKFQPSKKSEEFSEDEERLLWMLRRVLATPYEPPVYGPMGGPIPIFEEQVYKQ